MCLDSLTDNTKELTAFTLGFDVSINGISTEMAVGVTHGWSMLVESCALQVRTRSSKDLVSPQVTKTSSQNVACVSWRKTSL